MAGRYTSFEQFWPFYLNEHADATNRRLHFAGTTLVNVTLMAAMVTLGPRAHNDFVKITRVGIGDWSKAKLLNEKLLESYQKMVKWTTEAIEQKKWELEQVQCQISFLSIGATFEDAKAPEQE